MEIDDYVIHDEHDDNYSKKVGVLFLRQIIKLQLFYYNYHHAHHELHNHLFPCNTRYFLYHQLVFLFTLFFYHFSMRPYHKITALLRTFKLHHMRNQLMTIQTQEIFPRFRIL
jgi:hypothetical protein